MRVEVTARYGRNLGSDAGDLVFLALLQPLAFCLIVSGFLSSRLTVMVFIWEMGIIATSRGRGEDL